MTKATPIVTAANLPAGSYNVSELDAALTAAATAKDPAAARDEALTATRLDEAPKVEQGARPDQERVTVKNEELGIEETVLVHKAGSEEAEAAALKAEKEAEIEAKQAKARATRGALAGDVETEE